MSIKQTTQKEGVAGPPTGVKQKVINMIFKVVGVKSSTYNMDSKEVSTLLTSMRMVESFYGEDRRKRFEDETKVYC